jgi:hypothetical protein
MENLMFERAVLYAICLFLSDLALAGVSASGWQLTEPTPLMRAAREGDISKVQELLNKGHNVNEQQKRSQATPLVFAASAGKTGIVKLLLDHGANPNLCSWDNVCPIWWATKSGSYDTVRLLIKSGANVKTNQGLTRLNFQRFRKLWRLGGVTSLSCCSIMESNSITRTSMPKIRR